MQIEGPGILIAQIEAVQRGLVRPVRVRGLPLYLCLILLSCVGES